jgi:hypothetical protein
MALPRTRASSFLSNFVSVLQKCPVPSAVAAAAGLLAVTAVVNRQLAQKAQRDNPPKGQFIEINGVHLHYVERGAGRPLVLLHGNGSMIQDFESSGLIDLAAENYRVIVPVSDKRARPLAAFSLSGPAASDEFRKAISAVSAALARICDGRTASSLGNPANFSGTGRGPNILCNMAGHINLLATGEMVKLTMSPSPGMAGADSANTSARTVGK